MSIAGRRTLSSLYEMWYDLPHYFHVYMYIKPQLKCLKFLLIHLTFLLTYVTFEMNALVYIIVL